MTLSRAAAANSGCDVTASRNNIAFPSRSLVRLALQQLDNRTHDQHLLLLEWKPLRCDGVDYPPPLRNVLYEELSHIFVLFRRIAL
jgi:hypothetical protein